MTMLVFHSGLDIGYLLLDASYLKQAQVDLALACRVHMLFGYMQIVGAVYRASAP
jgi:hypothetical protein